jgi:menaquinone-dependent protoporphyrinogen oxidase
VVSTILVIYATHYGQTRAIATRIAQRLRERGHDVDMADAYGQVPPPQDYDAIVIGSRVELGRHASPIRAFIRSYREDLLEVPTAFFSVSMAAARSGASFDPNGYMIETFDDVGWYPTVHASFAGALPYRKYSWLTRAVMKRISKSAGHTTDTTRNHEFTDWNAVDAFADKVHYIAGGERAAPELRVN